MKQQNKQQLTPEQAQLQAQIASIAARGISPEQLMTVIDGIINGDLADKKYKAPDKPLIAAKDKQKQADRIINNYGIALASLAEDRESGKDDQEKSILKLTIIVGAASAGLSALGFNQDDINTALGLSAAAGNK